MEIIVRMFGLTVFQLTATTDEDVDDEPDGTGVTASTPVSFVARHELPDGVGLPDRDY